MFNICHIFDLQYFFGTKVISLSLLQTVELTSEVIDYLKGIFNMFDIDNVSLMYWSSHLFFILNVNIAVLFVILSIFILILSIKNFCVGGCSKNVFMYQIQDEALLPSELDDLFSTAPEK